MEGFKVAISKSKLVEYDDSMTKDSAQIKLDIGRT